MLPDDKTESSVQPTSTSPALPGEDAGWSEGTCTIITLPMEELAVTGSAKLWDCQAARDLEITLRKSRLPHNGLCSNQCHRSCIRQTKIGYPWAGVRLQASEIFAAHVVPGGVEKDAGNGSLFAEYPPLPGCRSGGPGAGRFAGSSRA